jgi:hypothetical protein
LGLEAVSAAGEFRFVLILLIKVFFSQPSKKRSLMGAQFKISAGGTAVARLCPCRTFSMALPSNVDVTSGGIDLRQKICTSKIPTLSTKTAISRPFKISIPLFSYKNCRKVMVLD